MGPHARLNLVEYPSEAGGAPAYDVTAVSALTSSAAFVTSCSLTPGHAAVIRYNQKLKQQYQGRIEGSRLIPLVVELGGRWHPQVHHSLLAWVREACLRNLHWGDSAAPLLLRRWSRRLSALLLRGVAQVLLESLPGSPHLDTPSPPGPSGIAVPNCIPEGASSYELFLVA